MRCKMNDYGWSIFGNYVFYDMMQISFKEARGGPQKWRYLRLAWHGFRNDLAAGLSRALTRNVQNSQRYRMKYIDFEIGNKYIMKAFRKLFDTDFEEMDPDILQNSYYERNVITIYYEKIFITSFDEIMRTLWFRSMTSIMTTRVLMQTMISRDCLYERRITDYR